MYHVIVNPEAQSGNGRKYWEIVQSVFDKYKREYEVHFTEAPGDIAQFAQDLYNENGSDLHIVVMGGDGSVNEILQGLPSTEGLSLSLIPVGSANDFARCLGISFDPFQAATHLVSKPTAVYTDIGNVHCENTTDNGYIRDRRFIVSTGGGYDAAVCQEAQCSAVKSIFNRFGLGKLTYLSISLKQLMGLKPVEGELILNNSSESVILKDMLFVAAMNTKFEGGGFMFAPDASHFDGLLDLCCAHSLSKFTVLTALPQAMKGNHFKYDGIDFYRTSGYTLKTSEPVWVHTDGEVNAQADIITVRVDKEAIKIVY